ncbi:hypothetical protein ABGB18_42655 [Nonomuraea sp. B12E4]|uniref:hypothetical protein n=1 Tax=Nonomuraea sp. B12E4 TaxID=3153564 RepID=UPI00325E12C5
MGADRGLLLELDVCAEYRIPHSAFLSWDQDDRDKALWHHIWRRQECPNCRTREEEWDESRGGYRYAYVPEKARCRGCEVKEQAQETVTSEDGRGVYITLIKNEEVAGGDA